MREGGSARFHFQTNLFFTGLDSRVTLTNVRAGGRREIKPTRLSSLEVNVLVVEILEAAHCSADSGKRIDL